VIQVLRYLEGRINAMMDIWGIDGEAAGEKAAAPDAPTPALTGPSEIGLDQADVDVVMAPDCGMEIETRQSAAALVGPPAAKPRSDPSPPAHVSEPKPEHPVADPLRPILALSPEEKIALFS
jgi:chemotaxis protein CheZ